MKLLYEASNTIEAHMILHLLEQAGLSARIDGEYLQGGIGELQAMGVVRIMIEETDYSEAQSIVQEWNANQPKEKLESSVNRRKKFEVGFFSFLLGMAVMAVFLLL